MSTRLADVITEHRWAGRLDLSIDTDAEGIGEHVMVPMCACGWRGDDWPAHVADRIAADLSIAVVELPTPDDDIEGVWSRWFLPSTVGLGHSTVGCDVPGAVRRNPQVWMTPFSRCTPDHARKVAAALLAAADRAEQEPS